MTAVSSRRRPAPAPTPIPASAPVERADVPAPIGALAGTPTLWVGVVGFKVEYKVWTTAGVSLVGVPGERPAWPISLGEMLLPGLVVVTLLGDTLLLVAGDEVSVLKDMLALDDDVDFFLEVVLLSVFDEMEDFRGEVLVRGEAMSLEVVLMADLLEAISLEVVSLDVGFAAM